jgi:hypothetical protein
MNGRAEFDEATIHVGLPEGSRGGLAGCQASLIQHKYSTAGDRRHFRSGE